MKTSHLVTYLNESKIPFKNVGFGVQIYLNYYDKKLDKFNPHFLDSTFIINFPK